MITPDKRPIEHGFTYALLSTKKCPKGKTAYFATVWYTDNSTTMLSNIYATSRAKALSMLMKYFCDCNEYIRSINLLEQP